MSLCWIDWKSKKLTEQKGKTNKEEYKGIMIQVLCPYEGQKKRGQHKKA